jgi:hypothetical protein
MQLRRDPYPTPRFAHAALDDVLTGDYIWSAEPPATVNSDGFRPLRAAPDAARKAA